MSSQKTTIPVRVENTPTENPLKNKQFPHAFVRGRVLGRVRGRTLPVFLVGIMVSQKDRAEIVQILIDEMSF